MAKKINTSILKLLNNKDWLIDQHHTQKKSSLQIARDLNVSGAFVRKHLKKFNIDITNPKLISTNIKSLLMDKNWLIDQHHTQKKSSLQIGKELGVCGNTIRIHLKLLSIASIEYPHLSNEVLDCITDKNWLIDQHHTQKKSSLQIGKELGVCGNTVREYLKLLNIPNINYNHVTANTKIVLNDKSWLIDQHHTQKKSLKQIGKELNIDGTTVGNYLRKFKLTILQHQSAGETEILSFIKSILPHTTYIQSNTRSVISPLEIDIYIPEYNLAIEYCGLYWHSTIHDRISTSYHKNKYDQCNHQGIRLLTIFEDEWLHRRNQVKSKIKSILKKDDRDRVYARNCKIINVDINQKRLFFEKTHIQGNGPGSITYGLEYKNELVACMTFIAQKTQHYLNRYATSKQVIGGFSKLLTHFQRNNKWNKLISFADLRWSRGDLYDKTGWTLDSTLPPDYSYVVGDNRKHKFNFRKHNLSKILKYFDVGLSETQNCDNNGLLRIYDCGKLKYIYNNND